MHNTHLSEWIHNHTFDEGSEAAEQSTRVVMWIISFMNLSQQFNKVSNALYL